MLGHVGDREVSERLVVARVRAGLEQQRAGWDRPARDDHQVAFQRPLRAAADGREHRLADRLLAARLDDRVAREDLDAKLAQRLRRRARSRTQVGDGRHRHTDAVQRDRRLESPVRGRRHHCPGPGLNGIHRGQPARSVGQHHAGQIVAGEHQRLLDRAGRDHVPARAELVQRVALPDRDQAIEEAQRGAALDDLRTCLARSLNHRPDLLARLLDQQAAAGLWPLVDQHDVGAELRGRGRGADARRAAADDEHVGVPAPVLGAPLALGLLLREATEPGGVAQHLLVQRPQLARADERLVVEAGRRDRAGFVGHAHHVDLERRERVEVLDAHARADRLDARAGPGRAVDGDDAVRAVARAAHQPAPPVVLEASRERAPAGGVERRPDRVALERLDALAVEREADHPVAVDPLAGLLSETAHGAASPGRVIISTSLVRVSRSAMNHALQPDR